MTTHSVARTDPTTGALARFSLEHVACDLCECDRYKVRYRKPDTWLQGSLFQFPVVECANCGLVYVNPRPTAEAMARFYPGGYHDARDTAEHNARYKIQRSMIPKLEGKSVLDIGCARGDFLAYLLGTGEKFSAYGVDAFSEGVCRSDIRFHRGTLTDARYADAQFDLVTSWAVFEHLHTPKAYFVEAGRILRPGGKMVILVTNSESAYGRVAQLEDVPRHTYHYSARSLAGYGARAGLRLVDLQYRDDVFDGRGFGSIGMLVGRMVGFTWEREMLGSLGWWQRLAMRIGRKLDLVVFSPHWEAWLGRSGIMVATYAKD